MVIDLVKVMDDSSNDIYLDERGRPYEGPLVTKERDGILYSQGDDGEWYTLAEMRLKQRNHAFQREYENGCFRFASNGWIPVIFRFSHLRSGEGFRGIEKVGGIVKDSLLSEELINQNYCGN